MLFESTYLTPARHAESVFRDRGSKFLGHVFPVRSEEEIRSHLLELEKLHPSAAHHCYAWRLGADKQAYRVNDDGEPSGSAGKPIFSQILSNDLTNVLVVVVRYFGGSLLGVPGLIHAYRQSAAEAIAAAGVEKNEIQYEYQASFGPDDMNAVMRVTRELGARIVEMNYHEQHEIIFRLRRDLAETLESKLNELYRVKYKALRLIQ